MRHLVGELGEDALNFLAFIGASDEETDKCRDIIKNNLCCTISQLEISGKDLTELGISGKKVGEIISRLLEEVIRDAIPNEYNALIIKAQELF